jgi:glycine/D-amino acid oxidase-like deaminating enzyme
MLGIALNVQGVPIQVSVTGPVAPFVPHLVYAAGRRLTLKQAANGTVLIGGGWPGVMDARGQAQVDPDSLLGNLRMARTLVPAVAGLDLVRAWAAVVNGTADWRPILGEMPGEPGFFVNFFPWTGFTAGPLSALLTAEMALGRVPSFGLHRISVLAA